MVALFLTLALLKSQTDAHMTMDVPSDAGADTEPGYELCKGKMGKYPTPLKAGLSLQVKLRGTIHHDGGGCQFGLSYDNGETCTVILTTNDKCPAQKEWSVPIPGDAPSCADCVFTWGWIPKNSGGPEYDMNCAQVQIEGSSKGGKLNEPKMQFFNMPGFPSVHADGGNGAYTNGLTIRFGSGSGASGGENDTKDATKDSTPLPPTAQATRLQRTLLRQRMLHLLPTRSRMS
jgi:hypothetical protein